MVALQYRVLDSFSSIAFGGNPAAVIILDTPLPEQTMQLIAREFNISETAFVVRTDKPDYFDLRWFTPALEALICGHATLASAAVLGLPRAVFRTKYAGELIVTKISEDSYEMEFPAGTLVDASVEVKQKVLPAIGKLFGVDTPPVVQVSTGGPGFGHFLFVRLADGFDLAGQKATPEALTDLFPPLRSTIITCKPAALVYPDTDYLSRVFVPVAGIPEDPVNGSSQCLLGPYWSSVYSTDKALRVRQVSSRGGDLIVQHVKETGKVKIGGKAVETAIGEVYIPDALVPSSKAATLHNM
ncbi:Diaminopimelate epimerase-like protein [Auriculariales sp. MPI-PUGE-AT-0066]|nr:Diaminopimelate epimerase-like protein [Auriculariales sp. MPI-PUGE-AT-0066]